MHHGCVLRLRILFRIVLHLFSNRYISQESTVMPAVSVRRIRRPSVMGIAPTATADATSLSSKPPSGPINTAISCPGSSFSRTSLVLLLQKFLDLL